MEHTPPSSSGGEGEGGGGEVTLVSSTPSTPAPAPAQALAPSLTPASQPTISLLTDSNADTLSVESLTLLPPADSPHLHPCATHVPATLQRPDAAIAEEEEDNDEEAEGVRKEEHREKEELEEEEEEVEGSPIDETPPDEAPEEPVGGDVAEDEEPVDEDTPVGAHRDPPSAAQVQERDDSTAAESVEKTEDAEMHSETPDSPELD